MLVSLVLQFRGFGFESWLQLKNAYLENIGGLVCNVCNRERKSSSLGRTLDIEAPIDTRHSKSAALTG